MRVAAFGVGCTRTAPSIKPRYVFCHARVWTPPRPRHPRRVPARSRSPSSSSRADERPYRTFAACRARVRLVHAEAGGLHPTGELDDGPAPGADDGVVERLDLGPDEEARSRLPPGRIVRANSSSGAEIASGSWWTVENHDRMPPNTPSAASSRSIVPTSNRMPACATRACSTNRGARSTPRTSRPRSVRCCVQWPGRSPRRAPGPQAPRPTRRRSPGRPMHGIIDPSAAM